MSIDQKPASFEMPSYDQKSTAFEKPVEAPEIPTQDVGEVEEHPGLQVSGIRKTLTNICSFFFLLKWISHRKTSPSSPHYPWLYLSCQHGRHFAGILFAISQWPYECTSVDSHNSTMVTGLTSGGPVSLVYGFIRKYS